MNRLCLVFLGALLLALHLTSQVQAQNITTMSPTTNMTSNTTMDYNNTSMSPTPGAGGRTEVSALLLPLALGFLFGCS